MQIEFVAAGAPAGACGAVAVLVFEGAALSGAAAALDRRRRGLWPGRSPAAGFTGAKGTPLERRRPGGAQAARVLLVGAAPRTGFDAAAAETAAAEAYQALKTSGAKTLTIGLDDLPADVAARAALGVRLAAYRFDRYRTKEKPEKKPSIKTVRIAAADVAAAQAAYAPLKALADAVDLRARPGLRAGQHPLSGRVRPPGQGAGADGAERRGAGRGGDGQARHGLAARRRPGQRARQPARRSSSGRARPTRTPSRSPSSARASASTPAASASSRPRAWRR